MKPRIVLLTLLLLIGGMGVILLLNNQQPTPPQQVTIEVVPTAPVAVVIPEQTLTPTAIPKPKPSPQSIPSSTEPGGIAGKVTMPNGQPIEKCEVVFLFYNGPELGNFIRRGRYRESEPFAVTDATGIYCGENLPRGSYRVVFIASGYVYTAYQNPIVVPPGKIIDSIDQVLEPAGKIEGYVIENLSANPIEGVNIQIKKSSGINSRPSNWNTVIGFPIEFTTCSDAEGKFLFDFVPNGEHYDLLTTHPEYTQVKKDSIRVSTPDPIRIVLTPGGSIEGRVVSEIPGIDFKEVGVAFFVEEEFKDSVKCDQDGLFCISGLSPNSYQLIAGSDESINALSQMNEPIYVGLGKKVSGIELKIARPPKVSGKVIDKITQEGIPNVLVRVGHEKGRTDTEGRFEIEVFEWWPCKARVSSAPRIYIQPDHTESIIVPTKGEDIEGVILELMPGAVVRGKVVSKSGEPVRNVRVEACRMLGENRWDRSSPVYTGKDGSFELSQLHPSENCRIMAFFTPPKEIQKQNTRQYHNEPGRGAPFQEYDPMMPGNMGMGSSFFNISSQKVTEGAISNPFSFEEGKIKEDILLQLESCASISGTVKDAHGNPLGEDYQIQFSQVLPEGNRFLYNTQLNNQGFYFSNELPAGEISVSLINPLFEKTSPLQPTFHEKKVVTTQAGKETSNVNFIVHKQKGYRLSGRVVDDQGKGTPMRKVNVLALNDLQDPSYSTVIASGVTDEDGFFQGENIPAGKYLIRVRKTREYGEGLLEPVQSPAENLVIVTPRFAWVGGQVVSKNTGKPLRQFQVEIFDEQGNFLLNREYFEDDLKVTGNFQLYSIPPTSILLKVKTSDDKIYEHPLNLKPGEHLDNLVIEVE